jgi:hypothetical protein
MMKAEEMIKANSELVRKLESAFDGALPYWFVVRVGEGDHVQVESYDFFPGDGRGRVEFDGTVSGLEGWLDAQLRAAR